MSWPTISQFWKQGLNQNSGGTLANTVFVGDPKCSGYQVFHVSEILNGGDKMGNRYYNNQ